jgi:uncharacterized protein YbjT (DUF2867 family)
MHHCTMQILFRSRTSRREIMKTEQNTTLIVGGSGKTGKRVAERLGRLGRPTRLASRRGPARFDWAEPDSWQEILRGVGSVYLTFAPDLAVPGAAELIRAFSSQAVASGVENIVLLSGRGEPHVLPSEQAVRESGARFTIIRSAWFAQNFSEGHLVDQVRSGVFAFPGGDCAEPFLDIEDIADVAVAALTDSRHSGQIYELTGPRLLTFHEALKEISAAAGRTITYVPISKAEYRAALLPHLPAEVVYFMTDLFEAVLDGHNSHLANGVELALGRKARDFSDFARTAAATGAFGASAAE